MTAWVQAIAATLILCAGGALAQQTPDRSTVPGVDLWLGFLSEQSVRFLLAEAPLRVNRYVSVAPAYAFVTAPSLRIHQLRGSVTVRRTLGPVIVDDRNMIVRQFRLNQVDSVQYRNRLRLTYAIAMGHRQAQLFVADEVFYDWQIGSWTRNWASAGGSVDLRQNVALVAYYRRQAQRDSRGTNAIICALVFRLPALARDLQRHKAR